MLPKNLLLSFIFQNKFHSCRTDCVERIVFDFLDNLTLTLVRVQKKKVKLKYLVINRHVTMRVIKSNLLQSFQNFSRPTISDSK